MKQRTFTVPSGKFIQILCSTNQLFILLQHVRRRLRRRLRLENFYQ